MICYSEYPLEIIYRSVHIEFFFFLKQMSFDPNLLHNNGHNGYPNGTSAALRETGVIEKLLTSYGFIQCSERQARLFFHCSQYNGNLQDLKVGGNLSVILSIKLITNFSCISTYSWECYNFGLLIVPITEVCTTSRILMSSVEVCLRNERVIDWKISLNIF